MTPGVHYPEGEGGREACLNTASGLREYRKRIEAAWFQQYGICSICLKPARIAESTLVSGLAAHFWCHVGERFLVEVAS